MLLGVNSDENRDDLKKVIAKEKISWRSWYDGNEGPIAEKWQISNWPSTFVLDAKGMIRFKDLRGEQIGQAVDRLLKESDGKK